MQQRQERRNGMPGRRRTDQGAAVWTLGERLRKARKEAGLEQADMARACGVSQASISEWERDQSQPRDLLGAAHEWAKLTGASEAWLLGLTPRMYVTTRDLKDAVIAA